MPLTPSTGYDITGTVRLMTLAGSTTGRRFTLVALLALTMAVGTFIVPAVGVLASSIRQDLGLEPWQLGLLVTGSPGRGSGTGARRVATDQIGGKRSIVVTLAAALTLALLLQARLT